jgi:tetratricopeptide (TPR) repeat protein
LHDAEQVLEVSQIWHRIGQEIGDRWAATVSLNFSAIALMNQRKLIEAQEKIDEALQTFSQEIGEHFGLTWAALIRGRVALAQGSYTEAKSFYEHSLKAAQALKYRRTTQQAYDNLGDVAFYLGELDQAEHYFRLSLEVTEETGQIRELLAALYDLAKVWGAQGKKEAGVELLAVVLHHPLNNLPLLLRTEDSSLKEAAERLRDGFEANLEPESFQTAWARGSTIALEQASKVIKDNR